jgi:hypothetical protein
MNGVQATHSVRYLKMVERVIARYGPDARVHVWACWRRACDPQSVLTDRASA